MSTAGMPENERAAGPEPSGGVPSDIAERERELARTRAQLGETIEALEAKLDVRSRATQQVRTGRDKMRQAARRTRDSATDRQGKPLPTVWAGVGAVPVVVGAVAVLMLRSRRRRRPRPHHRRLR